MENNNKNINFITAITPQVLIDDLILTPETAQTVHDLIEEHRRADVLRSHNLEPRNRLLLIGPPGNGKASLAEGIAHALSIPFLKIQYSNVTGNDMKETVQHLIQILEYVCTQRCVLFFDDIALVGREVGRDNLSKAVKLILARLDTLPSHVIVVISSSCPEFNMAIWQKFQIRLELPEPSRQQIEEWFRRFEKRTGHTFGITPDCFAREIIGLKLNFAEIEEIGLNINRRLILNESGMEIKEIIQHAIDEYRKTSYESHLWITNWF